MFKFKLIWLPIVAVLCVISTVFADDGSKLFACSTNGDIKCVGELLDIKKTDPNWTTERGRYSSLMVAAQNGLLNIVEKLIKASVNINQKSGSGYNALTFASTGGHLKVVDKLIEYGSEIDDEATNLVLDSNLSNLDKLEIIHSLEKGGAKKNLSQKMLWFKLSVFINKYPEFFSEKFAELFKANNDGFCNGLVTLYHKLTAYNEERFNSTIKEISAWNMKSAISFDKRREYVDFIKKVSFLQNPILFYGKNFSQHDLKQLDANCPLSEEEQKTELKIEYKIAHCFSQNKLLEFLNLFQHENRMLHIYFINHVVGIFIKNKNDLYYFDPNHNDGTIRFNNIEDITTRLYEDSLIYFPESDKQHVPMGFIVSTYGNSVSNYPNKEIYFYPNSANDHPIKEGYSAMCIAAMINCEDSIKYLLEKEYDLDQYNHEKKTILFYAIRGGNKNIADLLLQKGADPNKVTNHNGIGSRSLLLDAIYERKDDIAISLILNPKMVTPDKDSNTWTNALILASGQGQTNVVKSLLKKVKPDLQEPTSGFTALMAAAQFGHIDTLNVLIECGADIRLKNRNGYDAKKLAEHFKQVEVLKILEHNDTCWRYYFGIGSKNCVEEKQAEL